MTRLRHFPGIFCLLCWTLSSAAAPLGLPAVPVPPENPLTPAKIALGDRLFHDRRLSATGEISCASCHEDAKAFTDSPRKVSEGIRATRGVRNAPTVANAAYFTSQFWDGRSPSLEAQALEPLVNPSEMALPSTSAALALIRKDENYRAPFKEAFGKELEMIAESDLGQAIASYERSLVFGDSPFDRYQYKGERDAMSPAAVRGLAVFMAWGRCGVCHSIGPSNAIFTDNRFHNIGIGINRFPQQIEALAKNPDVGSPKEPRHKETSKQDTSASLTSELGRFAVTRNIDELGAFKTPGLRNVAMTAPYMHDGSLKTLREVVLHYVNGGFSPGDVERNPHMDPEIQFLELSGQQVDDLVAFLEALTSPRFSGSQPAAAHAP